MYAMGIKCSGHDTGAALIFDNGKKLSVVAISEERLNRKKHTYSFPLRSIKYCLDHFGLKSLSSIDVIGVDNHTGDIFSDEFNINYKLPGTDFKPEENFSIFKSLNIDNDKITFIHHLKAHAASTFYLSSFTSAAVLVVDRGLAIFEGKNGELNTLHSMGYGKTIRDGKEVDMPLLMGIGALFQAVTTHLDMGMFGAGKTMALASFNRFFREKQYLNLSSIRRSGVFTDYSDAIRGLKENIERYVTENYSSDQRVSEKWVNIAYQTQQCLENELEFLANQAMKTTGTKNLCMAGGVALSCVGNRAIIDSTNCEEIFIQPAASDEGIPLGCAFEAYRKMGGKNEFQMKNAYFGRTYNIDELEKILKYLEMDYSIADVAEVALLLSKGKIIANYRGGSEYGPRALGNRSILADPRRREMIDIINKNVKHRESFRPFAPSCHADKVERYFDLSQHSPYMIVAAPVKIGMRNKIPAVVHIDGTSRPQMVTRNENELYYDLIDAFGHLTGIYCLLNTSFNDNEPIVESYTDAIKTYLRTEIDYLYIEGILVERPSCERIEQINELLEPLSKNSQYDYDLLLREFCDYSHYAEVLKSCKSRDDF